MNGMKTTTKGILIAAATLILGGFLLVSLYTHHISEELALARREGKSDLIYLRHRIRELESELTASLGGWDDDDSLPTGGQVETQDKADVTAPAESDLPDTEAVSLPIHQSPETAEPGNSGTPTAQYLLADHNGLIGVFDATGELLQTVNVFVMTLPEADREALEVGIPAYSWDEIQDLVEKYQ